MRNRDRRFLQRVASPIAYDLAGFDSFSMLGSIRFVWPISFWSARVDLAIGFLSLP